MTDTLHVHPATDLVGHDTSTDEPDCVCGPQVQPEQREDGSYGWLIVHHSLRATDTQSENSASKSSGIPGLMPTVRKHRRPRLNATNAAPPEERP